jgi:hypothetical protein
MLRLMLAVFVVALLVTVVLARGEDSEYIVVLKRRGGASF